MLHGSVAQKYRQWTLVTNLGGVFAPYNIKDSTNNEIDGMGLAASRGRHRICGWEANGGFLTGSDIERRGKVLKA